jgi:dihydroorotate dehydrogenase electron transfer subunit
VTASVLANVPLCREHFRLVLGLAEFPLTDPGEFVQIACRDMADQPPAQRAIDREAEPWQAAGTGEWTAQTAMLRRPFSLADRRDTPSGVELDIIYRVVGVGTAWLSRLSRGPGVSIIGPLGNRFDLPGPGQTALLVGGGVGIPPMLYLAQRLAGRGAIAFCGAVTRDLLPLTITGDASPSAEPRPIVAEFARHGMSSVITTDDGSFGMRGLVTQALERWLDAAGHVASDSPGEAGTSSPVIYTCGPEMMMKRVAEIARLRGLECQVAVERAMACGMGTCQSCVIRVKAGEGWRYALACTDGPVFRGEELMW